MKDPDFKKRLLTSVIASAIVLIFIKPILEIVWNIIRELSSKSYSGFIDKIYKNAAQGPTNGVDLINFALIVSIYFFIISAAILFLKIRLEKYLYKAQTDSKSQEELEKFLTKRREKTEKSIRFYTRNAKKILVSLTIYSLIPFVLFFVLYFGTFAELQLNTSFNQRLNAVAPYISAQDLLFLKSKWALMKNRNDFEIINTEIEAIAVSNNLDLPENLLK